MEEIRAEREKRPTRTRKEPRLAYEIALGIIIGGVTLWILGALAKAVMAYIAIEQIRIHFGG